MEAIVGRDKEKTILEDIYNSKEAELAVIYGRRRVGKTFLIKRFYQKKPCIFFHITGIKDRRLSEQLQIYINDFCYTSYRNEQISIIFTK